MVDSLGAPPAHCPDHPDCFNVPSYLSAWFSETGFPMLTSLLHATPTDDSPPGTTPVPFANTVDLPPSHPTPTGGITPNAFNTKTPEVITETESAFDDPGPTDDSLQGPTPVTNNKEASEDLTATETEGATSAALTSTPQLTQTEGVGASNAQATDGSSGQFNSNATGRKQTRTSSSTDDIQSSSPLESTPFVNAAPGPTQSTSTEDTAEDENFNTEAFTPTSSSTPKGQKHSTSASSRTTTSPPFTSQSLSPTDAPTLSFSSSSSLLTSSPSPTATAFTSPAPAKSNNKMVPIVAGAVVPAVLLLFGATALFLYKRRQRARDRREWERTHAEIADAVRQVGGPATRMPSWSRGHSLKDSVLP